MSVHIDALKSFYLSKVQTTKFFFQNNANNKNVGAMFV